MGSSIFLTIKRILEISAYYILHHSQSQVKSDAQFANCPKAQLLLFLRSELDLGNLNELLDSLMLVRGKSALMPG